MTHHDPVTGETHEHVTEERVVTPAATPVAPAPTSDQVNVNAAGQRTYVESGPSGLAVVRRIVGLIFGILIGLILLRFVLLLLGANSDNGIVDAIYGLSEPLVAPFRGIFALETFRPTGNSVVDIAALVAIVGWLLIYLVVFAILKIPDRAP